MIQLELFQDWKNAVGVFCDLSKILFERQGGKVIDDNDKVKKWLIWYFDNAG